MSSLYVSLPCGKFFNLKWSILVKLCTLETCVITYWYVCVAELKFTTLNIPAVVSSACLLYWLENSYMYNKKSEILTLFVFLIPVEWGRRQVGIWGINSNLPSTLKPVHNVVIHFSCWVYGRSWKVIVQITVTWEPLYANSYFYVIQQ